MPLHNLFLHIHAKIHKTGKCMCMNVLPVPNLLTYYNKIEFEVFFVVDLPVLYANIRLVSYFTTPLS